VLAIANPKLQLCDAFVAKFDRVQLGLDTARADGGGGGGVAGGGGGDVALLVSAQGQTSTANETLDADAELETKSTNSSESSGKGLSDALAPLTGGSSNNKTASDVSQVKLNSWGDSAALKSSFAFSVFVTSALLLLFTCLRRWNSSVYHRTLQDSSSPESTRSSMFSWFTLPLQMTADEEVRAIGLDGWSLLEFYRFNRRVLCLIAPPCLIVLGPINWWVAKPNQDWLGKLDIANMVSSPEFVWVHAGFVWFVVLATTMVLYQANQEFLERRFTWLQSIPEPQATTVLLENVPKELRSDEALKNYFQGPNGIFMRDSDIVRSAYVVRRTKALRAAYESLTETQKAWALATHRRDGAEAVPMDVLEALHSQLKEESEEVRIEQEAVSKGVDAMDLKICAPSGFVTFSSSVWQRLALQERFRADRMELVASFPPDPEDVVYESLMDNVVRSFTWSVLGWLCLLGVFFFWSPLVVFTSSLTTLTTIRESVPLADQLLNATAKVFPWFPGFLEGVLATAALRFFLAMLPTILFYIIRTFFPVKAKSMAQFRLSRWYFAFLLIFVLLVTTLGRGLVVTAMAVASDPKEVIRVLATWLPQASHFYFSYMIFGWNTLAWELIRFPILSRYWWYRVFHKSRTDEAKKQSEPEDEASFGLGARMGMAALMSSISLVFCTCSPLILIFSIAYFCIGRITYGYLLVYAEERKPDLGGLFWVEAVRQVFFILVLYILLMTGVLAGQSQTYQSYPAALAFGAFLPLYGMYYRITSFEWETLPLEQLAAAIHAREVSEIEELKVKQPYRQPECCKDILNDPALGAY